MAAVHNFQIIYYFNNIININSTGVGSSEDYTGRWNKTITRILVWKGFIYENVFWYL